MFIYVFSVAFGSAFAVPLQTVSSLGSLLLQNYTMPPKRAGAMDNRLQGRHDGGRQVTDARQKEKVFFVEDQGGRRVTYTSYEYFCAFAPRRQADFNWMYKPLGWRRDEWNRDRCISWTWTLLLRKADSNELHRPVDGDTLKPDGYMSVEDMMSFRLLSCMNVTQEDMERVMRQSSVDEADGKLRFVGRYDPEGDPTGRLVAVMCCQGHNDYAMSLIDQNQLLVKANRHDADLPEFLYHGTFTHLVDSIWREGLIPGGHKTPGSRTHIHFVTRLDGVGQYSGVRTDADVVVVVKAWQMMEDGLEGFWSVNKVFLTEGFQRTVNNVKVIDGVPPSYIVRIYERKTGRDLTPHDVLPLPETKDDVPVDAKAIMQVHLTEEQAKSIQDRIAWTTLDTMHGIKCYPVTRRPAFMSQMSLSCMR